MIVCHVINHKYIVVERRQKNPYEKAKILHIDTIIIILYN